MRRLGLTHAGLRAYHRALVTPGHQVRIVVEVLNLDGDLLSYLTPTVLDGQVMVDVKVGFRVLTLAFLDPSRSVQFEPDSPGDAPLHRKRMIRVTYSVRVPELDDWVDCVVFTGPIWDFDREGAVVNITAHGLERQAMGNAWKPIQFKKKKAKTGAIKELLATAGENRLGGIPDLAATMPERMTITRMDSIWPRAEKLAESMDRQLFYPGDGRPVMRRLPSRPVFTFDERHLLTEVSIDRDPEGVFNTFEAIGPKVKGSKQRVRAVEKLPAGHPLSTVSLARNGAPHYLVKREENAQIKTLKEARARAERMRDDASKVIVNYRFDSLPIPHLDENDLVRVRTDEGTFQLRMQQFSIPLGWEGAPPMSVGDVKRTTRNHGRRRAG